MSVLAACNICTLYVQYTHEPTSVRVGPCQGQGERVQARSIFEDAQTVFADEFARLIDDPDHSEDEDRFILLGLSSSLRLLVVVHCYPEEGNVIRLISARKATKTEAEFYP